jgi:hypothetical protein
MTNHPQSDESAPVSSEAIMAEIRARIDRSQTSDVTALPSTSSGSGAVAELAEATVPPIHPAPPGDDLYSALHTARTSADVTQLPLSITKGQRGIGGAVRTALHNLVLYYVNMLALKQTAFNRAIILALTRMMDQLERRDIERISVLEREVQELKAALKARDDTP